MSDFKNGGVPTPDYDSGDVNYINDITEFTEDVFIYGDTYAQSYNGVEISVCLLYTSPSPRDLVISRMPSSA